MSTFLTPDHRHSKLAEESYAKRCIEAFAQVCSRTFEVAWHAQMSVQLEPLALHDDMGAREGDNRTLRMPDTKPSTLREWNATSYHLVANPHVDWGRAVLERLPLSGNETVIDAGCGTGRLTELLLERLPQGHVIAVDQSANMLERAEQHLRPRFGDRVSFARHDLVDLPHREIADAVFSTATFHWIPDHPRLFSTLFRALKPGGWLIAQCGGARNIQTIDERARAILREAPFKEHIGDWSGPWYFADAPETEARLTTAGFTGADAHIIEAPVVLGHEAEYREFLETVVLGSHLMRLPDSSLRRTFLDRMVAGGASDNPPWSLPYTRLNLQGQRPR